MIVDPVQSAISAYKSIDDSFRQDKLDEERRQQQQFQNSLALDANFRAKETHQVQMDQADRQNQLRRVNAERYKIYSQIPDSGELKAFEDDPVMGEFIKKPELVDQQLAAVDAALKAAPVMMAAAAGKMKPEDVATQGPVAKQAILNFINTSYGNQLIGDKRNKDNPNKAAEITDFYLHPNEKGEPSIVFEGLFTKEDGTVVTGPITVNGSSKPDDLVKFFPLMDILDQAHDRKGALTALQKAIKIQELEAQAVELGNTTLLEGLDKAQAGRVENKLVWKTAEGSPELNELLSDPLLGSAFKNIIAVTKAFGGSPKEALVKAQDVVTKVQTLAADKAEGQAFIDTFSGIMAAAGKNPTNPYNRMVDFFKENPAMIGRKGAVEALKAAQTAIASDRKTQADQRRDALGWARVEAIVAKSAGNGASAETKAANLAKRDIAVRLRDAQRAYQQAVKGGDPAAINDAVDNISYLNDQAAEVGVPLAKVPQRRETAEETEALRQQATENLKAQRGGFGKFFNRSPSPKAVQAEMERIRKTGTPASEKPAAAPPATAGTGLPQPAEKTPQQAGKAFLHGNTVSVNGQAYPLNPDGTVTISGRKYKVQ